MLNVSNTEEDVFLIIDGQVRSAIIQDIPLILFKVACSAVGVPLNILIACAILRLRRLHSKPRNIFLLGITASNLTAYVPVIFEIAYFFYPQEAICKCYVALVGLPDVFLLLNIFLSLADRYVAISHPLWHRKKVTVRRVTVWLIIGFILAITINKYMFIIGWEPFTCAVSLRASQTIGTCLVVLFTLCVIVRITVYQQTKKLLVYHRQVAVAGKSSSGSEEIAMNHLKAGPAEEGGSDPTQVATSSSNGRIHLHAQMNQQTLHRMELEATKTLVAGVTSLIVLASPLVIFLVSINICRRIYILAYCNSYSWLASYLKQLGLVHAIYHPSMYLSWNPEFSAAVFKGRRRHS